MEKIYEKGTDDHVGSVIAYYDKYSSSPTGKLYENFDPITGEFSNLLPLDKLVDSFFANKLLISCVGWAGGQVRYQEWKKPLALTTNSGDPTKYSTLIVLGNGSTVATLMDTIYLSYLYD